MQKYLSKETYKALAHAIDNGTPIDREIANHGEALDCKTPLIRSVEALFYSRPKLKTAKIPSNPCGLQLCRKTTQAFKTSYNPGLFKAYPTKYGLLSFLQPNHSSNLQSTVLVLHYNYPDFHYWEPLMLPGAE